MLLVSVLLVAATLGALKLSTDAEGGVIHEMLEVGSDYTSRFVLVTNTEAYALPINIVVEPAVSWLEVSAKAKSLKPSGTEAFSITLKPRGVAVGQYLAKVRVYPLITALQGAVDLNAVYDVTIVMDIGAAASTSLGEGSVFFGAGFMRGSAVGVLLTMLSSVIIIVALWLRARKLEVGERHRSSGGGEAESGLWCCYLSLPRLREQLRLDSRGNGSGSDGGSVSGSKRRRSVDGSAGDGGGDFEGDIEMSAALGQSGMHKVVGELQRMLTPSSSTNSLDSGGGGGALSWKGGSGRASAHRRAPPLELLDGATMDPLEFETLWQQLAPRRMWGAAICRATERELEARMAGAAIYCLASGSIDASEKFFFFARCAAGCAGESEKSGSNDGVAGEGDVYMAEATVTEEEEEEEEMAERGGARAHALSVVFKSTGGVRGIAQFVKLFRRALTSEAY